MRASGSQEMRLLSFKIPVMLITGVMSLFGFSTKSADAKDIREPITVQKGDTIEKLAERYGSTTEMWKKANFLEDHYLTIGQTLNIVFPYRVTEGDQLDYLARKYNTTKFAIKNLNHLENEDIKAGMVISIPVNSNRLLEEKNSIDSERQNIKKSVKQSTKSAKVKPKKKATQQKQSTQNKPVNQQAKPASGKRSIQMKATAYNVEGNEQWGRLTFSGTTVRHGVIAVDPNVIPLGTKVYVSGYDSPLLPKGGFVAVAEDTGGAIKGNRIDIFIDAPTHQVRNFGIQNVQVTILK